MSASLSRGMVEIRCNGEVNDMTREERIKGTTEKYRTNQAKHGERNRKWKAVKLFSLDRDERYETGREKET